MEILQTGETPKEEVITLARSLGDYDFIYLHFKKPDAAGEDGNFRAKVKALEEVDRVILSILKLKPDVLVITGDHSTPAFLKSHSWHPNPVLLHSRYIRPDGTRCAVTFTFDFDAQTLFHSIKADAVQVTQGEFGPRVGIWRLLDLFDKLNIKVTFFVPGLTAELYPEAAKAIANRGHELGCHGYAHEGVQNMSYNEEVELFKKITKIIENVSGKKPRGWRPPGGQLSPNTFKILMDTGFTYFANGMADDIPYQWVVKGGSGNLTVIPFDWALDDATFFFTISSISGKTLWPPSAILGLWNEEFDARYKLGRYHNLACHPFCTGRAHRLFMLERHIEYIKSHPDVWIAPCIDIVNYWEKAYPNH